MRKDCTSITEKPNFLFLWNLRLVLGVFVLMEKKKIGKIEHFFDGISVAVVNVEGLLKKGDKISIEGPDTNVQQVVESMQIDKKPIAEAKKGQSVGLKVLDKVRKNDIVYKV